MTIAHHPGHESLMSCSAGSMPEAFAAVMASHISVCPECRKELAIMEQIGVELFRSITPNAIDREPPIAVMRRAEADPDAREPRGFEPPTPSGMPAPLVPVCGPDLERVPWKRLAPGVQHFPLPLTPGARGQLRLLKVAAGTALPEHDHSGSELTLVLRGSYSDGTGTYKPGDVADMAAGTGHAPVADPTEGCVCLIASEGKIRFKSVLAKMWQPFTGL